MQKGLLGILASIEQLEESPALFSIKLNHNLKIVLLVSGLLILILILRCCCLFRGFTVLLSILASLISFLFWTFFIVILRFILAFNVLVIFITFGIIPAFIILILHLGLEHILFILEIRVLSSWYLTLVQKVSQSYLIIERQWTIITALPLTVQTSCQVLIHIWFIITFLVLAYFLLVFGTGLFAILALALWLIVILMIRNILMKVWMNGSSIPYLLEYVLDYTMIRLVMLFWSWLAVFILLSRHYFDEVWQVLRLGSWWINAPFPLFRISLMWSTAIVLAIEHHLILFWDAHVVPLVNS